MQKDSNPVQQEQGLEHAEHPVNQANPSILESRISIILVGADEGDAVDSSSVLSDHKRFTRPPTPANKLAGFMSADASPRLEAETDAAPSPVRPAASSPPTPEPEPSTPTTRPAWRELQDKMEKRALEATRAIARKPLPNRLASSTSLPNVLQTFEQTAPVDATPQGSTIRHPMPHRFASHPVLLQRHASTTSSLYTRSITDSPGPPPRSPLRLRRAGRDIGEAKSLASEMGHSSKVAPRMRALHQYSLDQQRVRSTVITKCTGPVERPKSRGKDDTVQRVLPTPRKRRDERTQARKMRDWPIKTQAIDAVVNPTPTTPRHRLKKARPQIQIPDLKSGQSPARGSSSASSHASWKKVTEFTRTPVSAVPSEDTRSNSEMTGYTPISPTVSTLSRADTMTLSPVMLVTEEVPLQRPKATSRSAKYAPRPRSASRPGNRRHSRQGSRTPTRTNSPVKTYRIEDAPPLPSPPPTKALPPTPQGSDDRRLAQAERSITRYAKHAAPVIALNEVAANIANSRAATKTSQLVTQAPDRTSASTSAIPASDINARLEAVEQQLEASQRNNAFLAAMLNDALNGPVPAKVPNWEHRIARRNAATQGPVGTDRSALDSVVVTSHGSRQSRA